MNPQRLGRVAVLFACGLFLLASCSNDLGITVFYDQTNGLKPDNPVRWQDQQIGAVTAVEVNPQGRVAVRLQIQSAFRSKVTDQCRFVLMKNAHQTDQRVVKLACLVEGGTPLSHGAEVEGSTTWGFLLEQGHDQQSDQRKAFVVLESFLLVKERTRRTRVERQPLLADDVHAGGPMAQEPT